MVKNAKEDLSSLFAGEFVRRTDDLSGDLVPKALEDLVSDTLGSLFASIDIFRSLEGIKFICDFEDLLRTELDVHEAMKVENKSPDKLTFVAESTDKVEVSVDFVFDPLNGTIYFEGISRVHIGKAAYIFDQSGMKVEYLSDAFLDTLDIKISEEEGRQIANRLAEGFFMKTKKGNIPLSGMSFEVNPHQGEQEGITMPNVLHWEKDPEIELFGQEFYFMDQSR